MTPADILELARAMQIEYYGQAERELAPTHQFAFNAMGDAMGDFITRVVFKTSGEHQNDGNG